MNFYRSICIILLFCLAQLPANAGNKFVGYIKSLNSIDVPVIMDHSLLQDDVKIEYAKISGKYRIKSMVSYYVFHITNMSDSSIVLNTVSSPDRVSRFEGFGYSKVPHGLYFIPVYGHIYSALSFNETKLYTKKLPIDEVLLTGETKEIFIIFRIKSTPNITFNFRINDQDVNISIQIYNNDIIEEIK